MTSTAISLSIPPWLEEICVRLRSNDPTLSNLNLNIRRLTEFTLAYLCDALTNNSHLETLNLTNCLVPPVNLQQLGQALARHTSLRILHLSYNKLVNINDLAHCLGTNTSLEELFLNYNQIQEDVAALAEALKYNTTLKVLHLGKNRIDDRGAAALARMIEHNSSLRLMSLVWNEIESQGIKCLLQSLQQNLVLEVLELDQNPGCTPSLAQSVRQLGLQNQYGRYLLQEQALPESMWPLILTTKTPNNSIDRMYFFLQAKPDLCKGDSQSQVSKE